MFIELFSTLYNEHFPYVERRVRPTKRCHWMTAELKEELKEKRRLHRLALKWPITYKDRYISVRDRCNQAIREARSNHFLTELRASEGNAKSTWQTINHIMGRQKYNECDRIE